MLTLLALVLLAPPHPAFIPSYTTAELPVCDSTHVNWVAFDSDENVDKKCNGSAWVKVPPAGIGTLTDDLGCTGSQVVRRNAGDTGWECATISAGGAPTTATYITQTSDSSLSAEQAMGLLGTGLVSNTTTTGVQSIYGGTACSGQFVRSLDASGASTCSAVGLSDFTANQGTTTTVLHGNAAGQPSFAGVSLTADATANQGTAATVLHGNATGQPSFGSVVSGDLNLTTTSCTNQYVTAISSGGVGTCTTDTLASAQHANQGTATTVLHGNAAGNPAWSGVSLTADAAANQGTTMQTLHGNAAGQPTWKSSPDNVFVIQDRATTSSTGASTTDLTWPIAASASQSFTCRLATVNTATSLMRFAVAGPASMAMVSCNYVYSSTSLTAGIIAQVQAQWASTCTGCTPSVTASVLTSVLASTLSCSVLNGSTAGNITIYFADSTNAQSNTLKKGSMCSYWAN
jgi:hypothetical protein